jgi:membrane protein YqaA with SNARE-associated domain
MGEKKYEFILQNSNAQRIRVLLFTLFILLTLIGVGIAFKDTFVKVAKDTSLVQSLVGLVKLEFKELTPIGLFYAGLIGGLFFVLMPLEFLFYASILKGSNPWLSLFLIVVGYNIANVINYYLGYKFSPFVLYFFSKKKVYEIRRFIDRWGGYGIFFSNISPLPAEMLTFALGIAKYNVYRLFSIAIVANVLKYLAIVGIALFFR